MQNHKLRYDLCESYDKHAQERESSTMQEWKIGERTRFLSVLQKDNKKKLLELGAGTGRDSRYFQDQGFEVVSIDLSPAMIELCRQKGLTAYVMDMGNIDFPENSFDAVYCMNSFLHLTKTKVGPTQCNHCSGSDFSSRRQSWQVGAILKGRSPKYTVDKTISNRLRLAGEKVMKTKLVNISLIKQPSAFLPLAMSLAALFLVVGHAAIFGIVHEADEGAAAHIWQILMAAQLPILAYVKQSEI
jgi:hypothetical protein